MSLLAEKTDKDHRGVTWGWTIIKWLLYSFFTHLTTVFLLTYDVKLYQNIFETFIFL